MTTGDPNRKPFAVGLNLHHDTSACVITQHGVFAAEEERWSDVKHHIGPLSGHAFPFNALQSCASAAGIALTDIDDVWVPRMSSVTRAELAGHAEGLEVEMVARHLAARVHLVSHHGAHAHSSGLWRQSPSMVLCIDGGGSYQPPDFAARERVSGFTLDNGVLEVVHEGGTTAAGSGSDPGRASTNSFGHYYRNLAIRCIPPGNEPEGSMMALAAFGGPSRIVDDLRRKVHFSPHGQIEIAPELGNFDAERPIELGGRSWSPGASVDLTLGRPADLAWAAQTVFEEMVAHVASHLRSLSAASDRLTFVGGCALNAQVVGRLAAQSGFEAVFVPPAPHDGGTAVGAAAIGWRALTERPLPTVTEAPAWGPRSRAPMQGHRDRWMSVRLDPSASASVTARLLTLGSVVALVDGAMEFGPRALGHRSVLARPDSRTVRDRVNRLKRRATYRPLAPAIIESRWSRWFHGTPDHFMNQTTIVRPELRERIPGVVHADGTARAQSVTESVGALHRVLEELELLTGVPIVLNTSLNAKGKPIVRTAEQALDVARDIGLDAVMIDSKLFLPTDWATRTLSLMLTNGTDDDGGQVDGLIESWFGHTTFAGSANARPAVAIAAVATAPNWSQLRSALGAAAILAASGVAGGVSIMRALLCRGHGEIVRSMCAALLDAEAAVALARPQPEPGADEFDRARHGDDGWRLVRLARQLEREMLTTETLREQRLAPIGAARPQCIEAAATALRHALRSEPSRL